MGSLIAKPTITSNLGEINEEGLLKKYSNNSRFQRHLKNLGVGISRAYTDARNRHKNLKPELAAKGFFLFNKIFHVINNFCHVENIYTLHIEQSWETLK